MADPHDWLTPIVVAARDHALATGRFETVNGHEPDPPVISPGITAAVWPQEGAAVAGPGLRTTGIRQVLWLRLFGAAHSQPRDDIDPAMMAALTHLLAAFHSDLTLGGLVRTIDIKGAQGQPLSWQAGWTLDHRLRMITIRLPLVIDQLWQQSTST